jgi:hypothetical protein
MIDPFGLKLKICVRSGNSHSWIYTQDLDTCEEHTYGRWRAGYGGTKESGVCINNEKGNDKYKDYAERCIEVESFTPTINMGYGTEEPGERYRYGWHDRFNNCTSYACEEWKRVSGEVLYPGWLYHSPDELRQSIERWNRFGGNPHHYYPPDWTLN